MTKIRFIAIILHKKAETKIRFRKSVEELAENQLPDIRSKVLKRPTLTVVVEFWEQKGGLGKGRKALVWSVWSVSAID